MHLWPQARGQHPASAGSIGVRRAAATFAASAHFALAAALPLCLVGDRTGWSACSSVDGALLGQFAPLLGVLPVRPSPYASLPRRRALRPGFQGRLHSRLLHQRDPPSRRGLARQADWRFLPPGRVAPDSLGWRLGAAVTPLGPCLLLETHPALVRAPRWRRRSPWPFGGRSRRPQG